MTEPLRDDPMPGVDDVLNEESAATGPGLPPPTAIESLVSALLEAGPDVAEHVVRAAQELLLAAQCIVDAADQAVHEQLDVRDLRAETNGAETTSDPETDTDTTARVLPLDLGE